MDQDSSLRAAIAETLRIRSVVPLGIPHGVVRDTKVGAYDIKAGTMVIPLLWNVHMNQENWRHSENFNPDRFIDNDEFITPKSFIPFQTGKFQKLIIKGTSSFNFFSLCFLFLSFPLF